MTIRMALRHPLFLPVLTALFGVVVTVGMWTMLLRREAEQADRALDLEARSIRQRAESQLQLYMHALVRMATRWELGADPDRPRWEADAAQLRKHQPGPDAVGWIDKDGEMRWLSSDASRPGFAPELEATRQELLSLVRRTNAPQVAGRVPLPDGAYAFLMAVPVSRGDAYDGFLVATFRFDRVFDGLVGPEFTARYEWELLEGPNVPVLRRGSDGQRSSRWMRAVPLRFNDREWTLRVWPKGEVVESWQSPLRTVAVTAGVLMSFLAGVAVFLAHQATARARDLQTTSALQRVILDNAHSAILYVRPDGSVEQFSAGAERMFGYRPEDLLHPGAVLRLHEPEDLEARAEARSREQGRAVRPDMELFHAMMAQTDVAEGRWRLVRNDGQRVPVRLAISVVKDKNGRLMGFVWMATDISEQLGVEQALIGAKEAAEESVRVKADFLARMSHEIRTPMNGVLGTLELTMATALTAEQQAFLSTALSSARSLLRIINDILDFSKVEAGQLTLERRVFSLRAFLDSLAQMAAPQAEARGLGFALSIPEGVPDAWEGDALRLRQVLGNLLDNALKFTSEGRIALWVEQVTAGGLEFVVEDTGIGLSRAEQEKVFDAFVQADEATTRRFGGTGLGLAICAQLVALMNGRIWVESEVGKGSRFHCQVGLCLAVGDEAAAVEDLHVPSVVGRAENPSSVLLAEDNEVNRLVVRSLLERAGHTVFEVEDGEEAIAAVAAGQFDIVLMDVQMPRVDGLTAARAIREANANTGRHLPIVALTAQVMPGDAQRCLDAGMDTYLPKPVDPRALLKTVDALCGEGRAAAGKLASGAPDLGRLKALRAQNQELAAEVVSILLQDLPRLKQAVQEAASCSSGLDLERAAHKLKGALFTLADSAAATYAEQLELKGRNGELDNTEDLLSSLSRELSVLERDLRSLQAQWTTS